MENEKEKQKVHLPNKEKGSDLTPKDQFIYVTIKRFENKDHEAFPSVATISKLTGASAPTIRKCIKNLEQAGYIEIERGDNFNKYIFKKYDNFEQFSFEFLDKSDLSFTEKAYLLASQRYMLKNKSNGTGCISMTNRELAENINLSESSISRCNKSLEKMNYMQTLELEVRDSITGCKKSLKVFDLLKLGQDILFEIKDKIDENTEDINQLKQALKEEREARLKEREDNRKQMEFFERKISKLEKQINNKEIQV